MLEIIRNKANSWVTRALFGAIVLIFIFFFGYNQINTPNTGPQAIVATVNGYDIRQNEFRLAYDSNYEMYKQIFKGEIPEGMLKMLKENTLQQLVNQQLLLTSAQHMGLHVANEELVKIIESNKQFQKDGQFDRELYKNNFLPGFENKYNLNYEDLLRNELLVQKLQDLITSAAKVSPQEAKDTYVREKTVFTFDVVKGPLKAEQNLSQIQTAMGQNNSAFKAALATAKLTSQPVGPLAIGQREQILGEGASLADYEKIFALNTEHSTLATPLKVGELLYAVRLVKKDAPSQWKQDEVTFTAELQKRKQQQLMQNWIADLSRKATIERFVDEG